jgi:hypothetical protein
MALNTPRIARIVPWSDDNEWDQVNTWLHSKLLQDKLQGVSRVRPDSNGNGLKLVADIRFIKRR